VHGDDSNRVVQDVTSRLDRIEQILPTLATKEDLATAVRPLATRDEMHAAIQVAVAPLATRDEMHAAIREEGDRTRQHFDVVAERLEGHIRVIAEGHVALNDKVDALRVELKADIAALDRRVTRLEASK
jgi:hypothetical protein